MPTTRKTPAAWLRWVLAAAGALIVGIVAVLALRTDTSDPAGSTDPENFDLPALDDPNQRIRLADHAGQPVVVNFFASWCTACDAELPGFAKLSRQLEGQITFIVVNALETGDPMYMPERHDIEWWPLATDIQGRGSGSGLHAALGGRGMPITAFYDHNGQLLHVDLGALPEPALRERLHDLYNTDT